MLTTQGRDINRRVLYINDMPQVVSKSTSIRLFADDCLVYRLIRSAEDQFLLQKDLDSLQQWTEKWGMRFNPSKCQVMHLSRSKRLTRYYELCGEILQTVDSSFFFFFFYIADKLQMEYEHRRDFKVKRLLAPSRLRILCEGIKKGEEFFLQLKTRYA